LASASLPRLVTDPAHRNGRFFCVYLRRPRSWQVERHMYDKGVETATAPAGSWLRMEQQNWYDARQQRVG